MTQPINPENNHIMKILITGSSGLIGSAVCRFFGKQGHELIGIDNNQRARFFGKEGDTLWNRNAILAELPEYRHVDLDIRNRSGVLKLLKDLRPDAIVHTAAQPSHDLAADIPFEDFDTNANGTHNLLEGTRQSCPDSPFVFMSTNKVYGDRPNHIRLKELSTRYDFDDCEHADGIDEDFGIDLCKHSLFGASKVAADIMVQEYGRYFNMPTCCLRGGCLTGPSHSGIALHGFLSYLVKCNITEKPYTIFGYKGKQVRDNIHSDDVARFIQFFILQPREAAVYNIGGGKDNTCSIWEAFQMVEKITGVRQQYTYTDKARSGDHICYYSDLGLARRQYPEWDITITLEQTVRQIVEAWIERTSRKPDFSEKVS